MIILTTKKKLCFYCFRSFTLSEFYVTFINRYWKEFSNWSSMILVESSRYVWTVSEMLVETSQRSERVILNDFSRIKKKNKWSSMKISLFVEINRLTIEYTAWNSCRCNIFFTVWWSTYRKINAYARSQNDNNDNLDSTNVLISDVQLLLLNCRREQRRSIIITRLSSRTATLKSCARRSSTIVTRLEDEYINWWRKRENDIINLDSQNSFYQPFSVFQMLVYSRLCNASIASSIRFS
jgi:hypothetical protein